MTDELTVKTARDLKKCTNVIQEFVLVQLNEAIADRLSRSVSVLHEDYVGTLTRCLQNLERTQDDDEAGLLASKALHEVRLTNLCHRFACSLSLAKHFASTNLIGRTHVSSLLQILQSAYQVNITLPTDSNLFSILIHKMKEVRPFSSTVVRHCLSIFQLFRTFHWSNCPRIDPDFKRSVATNMLHNLSEAK